MPRMRMPRTVGNFSDEERIVPTFLRDRDQLSKQTTHNPGREEFIFEEEEIELPYVHPQAGQLNRAERLHSAAGIAEADPSGSFERLFPAERASRFFGVLRAGRFGNGRERFSPEKLPLPFPIYLISSYGNGGVLEARGIGSGVPKKRVALSGVRAYLSGIRSHKSSIWR